MRYVVSCKKEDCYLRAAWYDDLGAAELLAFAHHNRTDDSHRVTVTDTQPALDQMATGASPFPKGGANG